MIQFLMDADEPLIPYSAYDSLISNEAKSDEEERLRAYRALITNISTEIRLALGKLCGFLRDVADNPDNKMGVSNLGIVFGPVLMRSRTENPVQMVNDSPKVIRITCSLIRNSDFFYLGSRPILGLDANSERPASSLESTKNQGKKEEPTSPQNDELSGFNEERAEHLQRRLLAQTSYLRTAFEELLHLPPSNISHSLIQKLHQIACTGPLSSAEDTPPLGDGQPLTEQVIREAIQQLKSFVNSVESLIPTLITSSWKLSLLFGVQISEAFTQMSSLFGSRNSLPSPKDGALEAQSVRLREKLKVKLDQFFVPFSSWFVTFSHFLNVLLLEPNLTFLQG